MNNILIIIPSLNPNEKLIDLIKDLIKNNFTHIAVVDDGSPKEYQKIFNELEQLVTVYHHKINKGKGIALKTAIKNYPQEEIKGYLTCDSDGQHSIKDIINIANELDKNQDKIILGVRDFKKKNVPIASKFGNSFSSLFFKFRTGIKCPDTQTGLRAFGLRYRDFALETEGQRYEYEMNFLIDAALNKYNFKFIKIETIYENNNKGSHFHILRDSYLIYKKPVKYLISSLIGSIIDLSIFTILIIILKQNPTNIVISTIGARIISGIVNFSINKYWTFKSNKKTTKQLIKYIMLFITIMLTSSLLVSLLSFSNINITFLKMIVDITLFIASYYIQNKYIFTK